VITLYLTGSIHFNGYWHSFPVVKNLGHDPDHSAPYSAEVKKECNLHLYPLSLHTFVVLGVVKDKLNHMYVEKT
jgi:hypothetical protein